MPVVVKAIGDIMRITSVNSMKRALGLGLLLWLVPFIISFIAYPLKSSDVALFDTIMAVTVALFGMIFGLAYFKKVDSGYLKEGIVTGILWLAISIIIDLFLFSWGPMAMPFAAYMEDIGLTYLIYPIINIGMGYVLEKRAAGR